MQPKPPLGPVGRLLLGLAFVAGAVLVALVAAPSTMTLTRTGPKTVNVTVETRLFSLYRIGGFRIDEVESVKVVENVNTPTGTGPEMAAITTYFVTRDGRMNYDVRQEPFDGHISGIAYFFASDAPSATFAVNDPDSRFGRFILVHLVVVVMFPLGILITWASVKALFSRDRKTRA